MERAWDCVACGVVFEGGAGSTHEEPPTMLAPASATAPRALEALREWVDENKATAVIISFVVYVISIWIFGALVIGVTHAPGAVKSAYREITGRPVPKGFGPVAAAHFVSRRLVVFVRPDQVFLVLYRDQDGASDEDLRRFAECVLELLEVPFEQVGLRTADTRDGTIKVPVLELEGEGGLHLYLVPTATKNGERAVDAVLGDPRTVLDVVKDMVEYR